MEYHLNKKVQLTLYPNGYKIFQRYLEDYLQTTNSRIRETFLNSYNICHFPKSEHQVEHYKIDIEIIEIYDLIHHIKQIEGGKTDLTNYFSYSIKLIS